MGKGAKTTTSTVTPDAQTQAARQAIFGQAQGLATNPMYQGLFSGAGGLGQQGIAALGGDQAAFAKFMNPYQQQILDANAEQYRHLGAQGETALNDQATRAGAFGGGRAQVAQGVLQSNIARDQAAQDAQLRYQGFSDAQQRAAQAANLGLNGFQSYAGLPAGLFGQAINGGGQTSKQTQPGGSTLGGLVGLGTTIAGFLPGGQIPALVGKMLNDPSTGTFGGIQAPARL